MATLTDAELAALDLIIEMKKAGTLTAGFIDNIVNDANNLVNNVGNAAVAVAAVTAAVAQVAALAAGPILKPAVAGAPAGAAGAGPGGGGLSVDSLIKIRKDALDARTASKP